MKTAYDQAIERIEAEPKDLQDLAKKVLSWITFAMLPLSVLELRHALGVEIDEPYLDDDNIPEVEEMLSACAGLVTINEESQIIRFVHNTTQEYFEQKLPSWIPGAQADIANVCITYLSFDVFADASALLSNDLDRGRVLDARMQDNVFLEYTSLFWGLHVRETYGTQIERRVIKFLREEAKVIQASFLVFGRITETGYPPKLDAGTDVGMHLAAWYGLADIIESLIDSGCNADSKGLYNRTPLGRAVESGHKAVVELLLSQNVVDINSKNEYGYTPLARAVESGNKAVVELLLSQNDVDINSQNKYGFTPLARAVHGGHKAMVELLLSQNDVDINSKDKIGSTPLAWAVEFGNKAVVELLLSQDNIDVNSEDREGETPLMIAAFQGLMAIMQILLQHGGVNVNAKDHKGRTALNRAVECGHEAVVELLREHNACATDLT